MRCTEFDYIPVTVRLNVFYFFLNLFFTLSFCQTYLLDIYILVLSDHNTFKQNLYVCVCTCPVKLRASYLETTNSVAACYGVQWRDVKCD